ncbi:hypothetical protein BK123_27445 [Paenibacillus lautus]|uniref:Uncharacterized protein n=1 Tax=Paenibacillus lautus TaxID=1401 RepID=A0A1R1AU33_PAELA|nr:hypothetical protein BK123_27445 [Paenibacillus lautus]
MELQVTGRYFFARTYSESRIGQLYPDYTGAFAPYGYRKDEQNKHKLIPDEHTAAVVQRIFKIRIVQFISSSSQYRR